MASRYAFYTGANALVVDWETGGTYKAMLLTSSWEPDPESDVFVADISANEFTHASYARQTIANPARDVDETISFSCDDIDFGVVSGGEVAAWLAIYEEVTNDSDSPIAAAFVVAYTADGVTSATFSAIDGVVFQMRMGCPVEF